MRLGTLICEPTDHSFAAGVIFYDNVGYLGICGHSTIGVATTLAHLGRIQAGTHGFENSRGSIEVETHETGPGEV